MKREFIHRRGKEDAESAQRKLQGIASANLCATPFLGGKGCWLFHASRVARSAVEQLR